MSNLPAATSAQSSTLAAIDAGVIVRAEAAFANPAPVTEITRLVPAHVCDAVLERMAVPVSEIGPDRAKQAVAALVAGYPQATLRRRDDGEAFDFEAYTKTLARTVAKFPEYAVMGMIDRKPWGHAFLPSEPEVKAACQDQVTRRAIQIANAKAHKREAKRRADEAAENARIEAGRGTTEEERKAQIEAVMARYKPKAFPGNEADAA